MKKYFIHSNFIHSNFVKTLFPVLILFAMLINNLFSYTIQVDINNNVHSISKYIYGLQYVGGDGGDGGSLPYDTTPNILNKVTNLRVTIMRQGGGNNSTKYNWEAKATSHPDWHDYHYGHDYELAVATIVTQYNIEAMPTAPLLGKVSAGGCRECYPGYVDTDADKQTNRMGYLDSILGINKVNFWCMDNEPMIWSGTHDDVFINIYDHDSARYTDYFEKYTNYAFKMKRQNPDVKLAGPEACNEWFWYYAGDAGWSWNKKPWLEWFIEQCANAEKNTGTRVLDIVSFHFYPGSHSTSETLELNRVFWDPTYWYDNGEACFWRFGNRYEEILNKIKNWVSIYYAGTYDNGAGIRTAITEMDYNENSISGLWYSDFLGMAGREDMHIVTPWIWPISTQDWGPPSNDGRIVNEIYYSIYMFTHFFGDTSVDCKIDGSFWSADLHAYSSLSCNTNPQNVSGVSNTLSIAVINQ